MRIKKYVAGTMPEALKLVKADLGPKAVILGTRSTRKSSALGILGKSQVEVTAAVDDTAAVDEGAPAARPRASAPGKGDGAKAAAEAKPPKAQPAPRAPQKARGAPGPRQTAPPSEGGWGERISRQIEELQGALQTTASAPPRDARPVLPGGLATLSQQMDEAGLERGLAEEVLTAILLDPGEAGLKALKPLQDRAVRLLARRFRPPCPTRLAEGLRTVVALVGPAGCGKTTAAARVAAHFASEHGARPAFVAADTDRVGGLEQLRAYAGILGFPVDVVRAPDEMGDVIRSRRDVDLILIDSAGASPLDSGQIDGLAAMLKEAGPSEVHLTLDASHGIRQMLDAVDAFARAGADRILLTKLDETDRLGAACCLAAESKLPLSYTTDGRAVPGHLHAADPEGLVRALFERRPHGPAG
jgi:flagellar biosynthesis protein FlhF